MSGPETGDFFNLEKTPERNNPENLPNFWFEIRNAPKVNPDAAQRVEVSPPDILQKWQDGCYGEIAKGCSWSKTDGSNSQSGSIGNAR